MKILIISQYYYPEQFRINDISEALATKGHDVTVVTGLPNYPEGEIYLGYEHAYEKQEQINGVNIFRCNLRPRHTGTINLFLNYLSFVRQAKTALKKLQDNYDIIYVYEISPITSALPALWFKKRKEIPVYLYCMDIWPECVRDKGERKPLSKSNPAFLLSKAISKHIYKNVDIIGVKCNQFTDYLYKECNVPKEKTRLLYEHAELNYLNVSEEPISNDCYDFMFLGNLGGSQRCDILINAIEKLQADKPFKLHFVGNGSDADRLYNYVKEHHLEELVVFHGRHPISEINDFYNLADCCIYNLSCSTEVGITPPGKLVSYMAASRPVIAAAKGASQEIINEADCGICVSPDNVDEIRQAMKTVLENEDEYKKKGKNGRAFFLNHFTLNHHVKELEKQLEKTIEGTVKT